MILSIKEFLSADGKSYFRKWLDGLDVRIKARIQARIMRFEQGNLGDHKSLGGGVWEVRVAIGPGYRIYFGKEGSSIILILLGGDKSSQSGDIRKARLLWKEYLEGIQDGKTD